VISPNDRHRVDFHTAIAVSSDIGERVWTLGSRTGIALSRLDTPTIAAARYRDLFLESISSRADPHVVLRTDADVRSINRNSAGADDPCISCDDAEYMLRCRSPRTRPGDRRAAMGCGG
jgi:hypothetical protein